MHDARTIIFDFGNTLAPFNAREADGIDGDLAAFVHQRTGVPHEECFRLWRLARQEDFRRSDRTGVEHDFRDRLKRVLTSAGVPSDEQLIVDAEERAAGSFVDRVSIPTDVQRALAELSPRYRLGVLSNYLLTDPIHTVLQRDGVYRAMAGVIVSKEVGFAKPHRRAFEAILDLLDARPEETIFVGDDCEADVRGSLACGLHAVWTWAMLDWTPDVPDSFPPYVRILRTTEEFRAFLRDPTG